MDGDQLEISDDEGFFNIYCLFQCQFYDRRNFYKVIYHKKVLVAWLCGSIPPFGNSKFFTFSE